MGKTVQVTCDGCGSDITTRSNSVDYRLVLASEEKPGYGAGAYTAMMIYPPVSRAYYFCALPCLDLWRSRERHETALWRALNEKWKDEHGSKGADGRVTSYPSMPEDFRKARAEEIAASALEAFPMQPKRR